MHVPIKPPKNYAKAIGDTFSRFLIKSYEKPTRKREDITFVTLDMQVY